VISFRIVMKNFRKSFIYPTAVILFTVFICWTGAKAFSVIGSQIELKVKVDSIERNSEYTMRRVDDIMTILVNKPCATDTTKVVSNDQH